MSTSNECSPFFLRDLQEYLAERAKLFDPKGSSPIIRKGVPYASSDTVLFTVTDESGSAMSYIQSNFVSHTLHPPFCPARPLTPVLLPARAARLRHLGDP